MNDAITIALEGKARGIFWLLIHATKAIAMWYRIRR
jgi:hypothetical protein